jgi:choline dehydrogenase-like flavoprotein
VVFLDRLGKRHHAMTRPGGEVILCAGALGSPQLLLLSGVGPRAYLATWGIPVVVPNPDVGQYLYDNPRNGISILPPGSIDHSLIQVQLFSFLHPFFDNTLMCPCIKIANLVECSSVQFVRLILWDYIALISS